jgi:hypothetical protein
MWWKTAAACRGTGAQHEHGQDKQRQDELNVLTIDFAC